MNLDNYIGYASFICIHFNNILCSVNLRYVSMLAPHSFLIVSVTYCIADYHKPQKI